LKLEWRGALGILDLKLEISDWEDLRFEIGDFRLGAGEFRFEIEDFRAGDDEV